MTHRPEPLTTLSKAPPAPVEALTRGIAEYAALEFALKGHRFDAVEVAAFVKGRRVTSYIVIGAPVSKAVP